MSDPIIQYDRCRYIHAMDPTKNVQCHLKANHAGDCEVSYNSTLWLVSSYGYSTQSPKRKDQASSVKVG
jgi:hypothetical protein